jgi:hypothetical protein
MALPDGPTTAGSAAIGCVVAWAVRRAPVEAIAELRRQPGPLPADPLPVSFLKHADEQTVIGLAAVSDAVAGGKAGRDFHDWGVLAAPRYLGRWMMATSILRYREEGSWGVSPHMIPHRSLHSVSGTVSQALNLHGPNFGTGGGPGGEQEALVTALALLHGKQLPGVWVVFTRVNPELTPDDSGRPPAGSFLEGLALALTLPPRGGMASPDPGLELTLRIDSDRFKEGSPGTFNLSILGELLQRAQGGASVREAIGVGVQIELSNPAVTREVGPVLLPGPWPVRPADRRSA